MALAARRRGAVVTDGAFGFNFSSLVCPPRGGLVRRSWYFPMPAVTRCHEDRGVTGE
jgi:hypothetical protein